MCNKFVCYVLIVCEIWQWSFPAWPTRLGSIVPSVLITTIQVTCVRLNLFQEDLIKCTLLWFGHSNVSEYSIHWTWYSLWNSYQWVLTQNLWVLVNFENLHLLNFISEDCQWNLRRKRAMWNQLWLNLWDLRLTCGLECECNILLNNRLMDCWQYVCGISRGKIFRSDKCFWRTDR